MRRIRPRRERAAGRRGMCCSIRRRRRLLHLVMLSAALTILLATNAPVIRREVLSDIYTIDRKYRSMEGPYSIRPIFLGDSDKPELLWLVGVKTEMVGADGKTPQLPELMCHVNVDYDAQRHAALFNINRS